MFPEPIADNQKTAASGKQQGSMLVMAIFVLTVLSLLGLAMVQILSDSNRSIVYEVYGARVFNAANSGADRALSEIFPPGASGNCAAVNTSINLSAQPAFHGCTVSVSCDEFTISETGYTHYRVKSTATCVSGEFTTARTVAVEARERN